MESGVLKLSDICRVLQCRVLTGNEMLDKEIGIVGAADLMSDVLAYSKSGFLLLTGQTNRQAIRTADIAEASAVIFVRGKTPPADTLELAEQVGIPVMSTEMYMFEACGRLFEKQMKPC